MNSDSRSSHDDRPMCPASWPDGSQCRFVLERRDSDWWCPGHGEVSP